MWKISLSELFNKQILSAGKQIADMVFDDVKELCKSLDRLDKKVTLKHMKLQIKIESGDLVEFTIKTAPKNTIIIKKIA